MHSFTTSLPLLAILFGLLTTAFAEDWGQKCASSGSACILTGPGIGVTSNFGGGAVNRGVIRGQGLTAWETAGNGPKGTIVGCHGKATWEFQEMGDSFYDATGQGNGRLYAWFRSKPRNKVDNGKLRSSVPGDDLFAPPNKNGNVTSLED